MTKKIVIKIVKKPFINLLCNSKLINLVLGNSYCFCVYVFYG